MKSALAQGLPWARRRFLSAPASAEEPADGTEASEGAAEALGDEPKGITVRVPVNSSSLYAVGHDPAQQVLEVEFLERGVVQYQNVPLEVCQEFQAASSKGT